MKKQKPIQKKAKNTKSSTPGLGGFGIVAALLLGLFVTGLFYIQNHKPNATKSAQKSSSKPMLAQTKPSHTVKTPPKPHFDFYNILPSSANETKSAPVEKTADKAELPKITTAEKAPAPAKVAERKGKYLIQVASFKNFSDADKIKAQLSMLGFEVNISSIKHQNQAWFRVLLGPYLEKNSAEQIQHRLAKNNYQSILVHLKNEA